MEESPIVLLFVCAVAAVFLLAACAIVRLILRRAGWMEKPSRGTQLAERIVLSLAGVGLLCFAYGYFVEPYWPEVTHVRIESAKLAGATRALRVVHISDLHCEPESRLEERLPDIITAERPDLIVYTGDSLNSPAGLPVLRKLLTRLATIAPSFAVRGNWDVWYWGKQELFGETGVRELSGEAVKVDVAGTSLWVAGVPYAATDKISDALKGAPPDAFTIFLYHTPDEILKVAGTKRVDLYCAGHTHGGQVALPVYGALITFSKFGKKYESGLYREGATSLYVTRGVGMEGGSAPRVRFFARPEVTAIELAPPPAPR
ncbi:MAG: metallophosphoesterase family protein [Rubrivivax sp.]|nr:metallophosphoesterase family protein [Pyrinomonadaceae bacterium]